MTRLLRHPLSCLLVITRWTGLAASILVASLWLASLWCKASLFIFDGWYDSRMTLANGRVSLRRDISMSYPSLWPGQVVVRASCSRSGRTHHSRWLHADALNTAIIPRTFSLHLSIPLLLAAAPTLCLFARAHRTARLAQQLTCPHCSYPRRGLPHSSPCPECGHSNSFTTA